VLAQLPGGIDKWLKINCSKRLAAAAFVLLKGYHSSDDAVYSYLTAAIGEMMRYLLGTTSTCDVHRQVA
jgi:hypothetical protein